MVTILVTGSDGQLGSELRELAKEFVGYEFIFTDTAELDITSAGDVSKSITAINPSWIVNCAGYTAVDAAEENPASAYAVNATGTANIAAAIRNTACRLIHISTDYVFSGSANIPYTETDEPSPVSIYGKSKLEGEINALAHHNTMIIRTSWMYGVYGKNFVKTILAMLDRGSEPRVVFDQTGSPTWSFGLASAIMSVVSGVIRNKHPFVPGIYNYSDEGVCSWFDIAAETALATRRPGKIHPVRTSSIGQKAARPAYSVLDKQKIRDTYGISIPHWRENLILCVEKIAEKI